MSTIRQNADRFRIEQGSHGEESSSATLARALVDQRNDVIKPVADADYTLRPHARTTLRMASGIVKAVTVTAAAAAPYAASITPISDADLVNVGTLTGALTVNAPAGTLSLTDGQQLTFRFTQDATGSRAITWNAAFVFGTDVTAALIPSTANAQWEMTFRWHAGTSKWRAVSIVRGF